MVLLDIIFLAIAPMRNLRAHVVELLAIADYSKGRCLRGESTLGILYLHTIDGEVVTIYTILQVADNCCPYAVVCFRELEGFAPRHGVTTEAYFLGIRGIDTEGYLTIAQNTNGLKSVVGCWLHHPKHGVGMGESQRAQFCAG